MALRAHPFEFEEDERETTLTPSWGAKRVLVVQHNDSVRHTVGSTLRRYGYVVIDAATMEDAVEHARRGTKIDVLLSDFAKNEISGPELLIRLRRFNPTIRAVFITPSVFGKRETVTKSTPMLPLPFRVSELLAALREAVGGFFN